MDPKEQDQPTNSEKTKEPKASKNSEAGTATNVSKSSKVSKKHNALYPFYAREYRLCEDEFVAFTKTVLISDKNFNLPIPSSPDLLVNICSTLEGMVKELHCQLEDLYLQYEFPPFYEDERFDSEALRFLDIVLGLTYKSINVSSELVLLNDKNREITPLKNASNFLSGKKQRPSWCYAYQACKHYRGLEKSKEVHS